MGRCWGTLYPRYAEWNQRNQLTGKGRACGLWDTRSRRAFRLHPVPALCFGWRGRKWRPSISLTATALTPDAGDPGERGLLRQLAGYGFRFSDLLPHAGCGIYSLHHSTDPPWATRLRSWRKGLSVLTAPWTPAMWMTVGPIPAASLMPGRSIPSRSMIRTVRSHPSRFIQAVGRSCARYCVG